MTQTAQAVPPSGLYKIVDLVNTASGSTKIALQSQEDKFSDPISGIYAKQKFLKHTVAVGEVGQATFRHNPSKDGKKGDAGFLSLDVWVPEGGVSPPSGSHTGNAPAHPQATVYHMDSRDKSIIRQTCLKVAGEVACHHSLTESADPGDLADAIVDMALRMADRLIDL